MEKRETFSGKLGFILTCVGSAIGLGNIWMFSWRLGQYGGLVFLIPYFIFLAVLAPIGLIGEIGLGRAFKQGSFASITEILKKKNIPFSKGIAAIPTIGLAGILLFYAIVAGWVMRYFGAYASNSISNVSDITGYFNNFVGTPSTIIWHGTALLVTLIIVMKGVGNGIEKINKIMMPALFSIFIVLMIKSLTLPGAVEGIKYLFIPKWSYLFKAETWIMALGQAFFTVSLTGCAMVVYGSYLKGDEDIINASKNIIIFDTLAALLAALVIIPAAFAFGLDVTAGPSLLFITVPSIFKAMPYGNLFGAVFFLGIIFATISSTISMMEGPVEAIMSSIKLNRNKSALIIGVGLFLLGIPLDLNMNLFGKVADIVTIFISPLGAAIAAIAFYVVYDSKKALVQINKGAKKPVGRKFEILAKYLFVPVTIVVLILGILLGGIG